MDSFMVFSSLIFLYLFLPICLILYFLAKKIRVKNVILLVLSLLFYAVGMVVNALYLIWGTFACAFYLRQFGERIITTIFTETNVAIFLVVMLFAALYAVKLGLKSIARGCLFLFGADFMSLFVDANVSQRVIDVGVEYLRVVSVFYIVMGGMFSTNGLLRGAGDVKAFMASTLCNFVCRVTCAYAFASLLGAGSIWWSIPMGWSLGLLISFLRYRSAGRPYSRRKNAPHQKRPACRFP